MLGRYLYTSLTGTRFDVLPSYAYPHLVNVDIGLVGCLFHGVFYRLGCTSDAPHNTILYPNRFGATEAEYFYFIVLATHTHKAGYFRGSNVKSDDDFLIVHTYCVSIFLLFLVYLAPCGHLVQTTWLWYFKLILLYDCHPARGIPL